MSAKEVGTVTQASPSRVYNALGNSVWAALAALSDRKLSSLSYCIRPLPLCEWTITELIIAMGCVTTYVPLDISKGMQWGTAAEPSREAGSF